jgi:hypothetical protein
VTAPAIEPAAAPPRDDDACHHGVPFDEPCEACEDEILGEDEEVD